MLLAKITSLQDPLPLGFGLAAVLNSCRHSLSTGGLTQSCTEALFAMEKKNGRKTDMSGPVVFFAL